MKKILTLFLVLIFANPILGQNEPNDCVNAIVVCGNGIFSSNANGIGNIQEVSGCSGFEHNSLWIKINIVQSGTLGFDLIPDDPSISVDYDFWVYGPNKSCSSLGSPIRCCTTNPQMAGLTDNHTGLNNLNPSTVAGPGANGNGYVYRLSVTAGQFYYIAIDRPVGSGGFQIQWNGTATLNGGAFPTPPTANQIPDMKTCSTTPNVGIFDLNSVRSQINSDLVGNTINFYTTLANAVDGVSPLPNIIANTSNPQTIYAKVVNNTSGCSTITNFNLRVYPVPSANISVSNTSVCSGDNVTVTFTGTPGATVEYTVNGGSVQTILLPASGTYQLTQAISANTTYALVDAKIIDGNNTTVCYQTENDVATVSVLVNTPMFTQVAPICSGGTLSALPTTSNNSITGTWSPALNNTATTTYTFTPNTGQCAVTATMTITVNPNTTPTFTLVAPICSGDTLSALPTTSNNGIAGTWSPALNNTATTTYTFTPTSGQCTVATTMTIVVNSNVTPTFTQVGPICSGASLILPTTSNNGIAGTWSPTLDNTATTTYTFTPTAGQCAVNITMTVTVNPNVTPTFTQVAPICSGTALAALPTTSNNGITGTWSPTLNNTATTTYTFTPSVGQCAVTATMTITVNPNVTPTFTQVASICSGGALSALPTTSNNGITGTWSPALNNMATTTYTFTPNAGGCATNATMVITVNPNVTPTFTQVAPICSGGTLSALPTTSNNGITGTWSPALNNTATTTYTFTPSASQCAVNATMTITVNPNVTPALTQVAPICSGTALAALPTTSNNGITGTWSPTLNNTATTTYTFTPSVGQCAVTTTMTITVNPNVTPTFTQVAPICSGGALSALPTTSNNGITGTWSPALNNMATTTYTFTPNAGLCATTATMTIVVATVTPTFTQVLPICSGGTLSALPTTSNNGITGTWSPALNNLATTTYTFTPSAGQCATTVSMTIVVNSFVTPTFTQVSSVCLGGNLTALPTISTNGITGSWSPAINNMATTTYTFTPTAGQCAVAATMTIAITPKPMITVTNNSPSICSGDAIDIVLNCNNLPTATIHWQYQSSAVTGGSNGSGIGPIHLTDILTLNTSVSVPTTVTLTVYAEGDCSGDEVQISVIINPLPKPLLKPGFICIDRNNQVISSYTLNTGLNSTNYSFIWYYNGVEIPGAIGNTYTVDALNEVGQYSVEATNTITSCHSEPFNVLVDLSYAADTATYVVSNYFENNQTITISVVGTGTYLYSLDGGSFQESNVFTYVTPGEHTVTIHDKNGCTDITIEHIFTINYPTFFTPNGDGYHDTWNVWSLHNQRNAEIHIFDRFGKFIKEIKPQAEGWDGTFNGQNLPATDYWFTIKYDENHEEKVFKAHFTLKR